MHITLIKKKKQKKKETKYSDYNFSELVIITKYFEKLTSLTYNYLYTS